MVASQHTSLKYLLRVFARRPFLLVNLGAESLRTCLSYAAINGQRHAEPLPCNCSFRIRASGLYQNAWA